MRNAKAENSDKNGCLSRSKKKKKIIIIIIIIIRTTVDVKARQAQKQSFARPID